MIKIGIAQELNVSSYNVSEFFKNNWNRPTILGSEQFYKWQFVDVPRQDNIDNCCIAIDNGIIVGVMGVNSREFSLENNKLQGAELTTWFILKEYRSKGVALKMLEYLQNKYDILIGMGISQDALNIYLRTGFHFLKAIPRYLYVNNWEKISKLTENVNLAKKVSKFWQSHEKSIEYIESDYNNSLIIDFKYNAFSRNYDYIRWRYINHPYFKYNIKVISPMENQNLKVFVCLRIEENIDNNLRILHVVDFYGNNGAFKEALVYIKKYAKENNCDLIDFFSTNSEINSYFIKDGWFSILDHDFFQFPHLFQPLELRNPATTSMIYWSNKNFEQMCDIGKLYITKQDCDFDRPNIGEYDE